MLKIHTLRGINFFGALFEQKEKKLSEVTAANLWEEYLRTRSEEMGVVLTEAMLLEMTQRIYTRDPLFADCYELFYKKHIGVIDALNDMEHIDYCIS